VAALPLRVHFPDVEQKDPASWQASIAGQKELKH